MRTPGRRIHRFAITGNLNFRKHGLPVNYEFAAKSFVRIKNRDGKEGVHVFLVLKKDGTWYGINNTQVSVTLPTENLS